MTLNRHVPTCVLLCFRDCLGRLSTPEVSAQSAVGASQVACAQLENKNKTRSCRELISVVWNLKIDEGGKPWLLTS